MREPGPLLAAGRDAEIFEYGPGLVLRRTRVRRSLAHEARVMDYVRAQGYPAPAVEELSDDGVDLVMERIDGVDMVATMTRRPWTIKRQGKVLADLHLRLHELAAPPWLDDAPIGIGDRILHLDLHPLNVIMSGTGPVVIDWTNAARGDPAVDVALAWSLMAAGSPPTGRLLGAVVERARAPLLNGFLRPFDLDDIRRVLKDVVAWKCLDPHMSPSEQARMWRLVEESGAGTGP
jgi:aminoglycoside phosphotransferase (APT) family kinase protein